MPLNQPFQPREGHLIDRSASVQRKRWTEGRLKFKGNDDVWRFMDGPHRGPSESALPRSAWTTMTPVPPRTTMANVPLRTIVFPAATAAAR